MSASGKSDKNRRIRFSHDEDELIRELVAKYGEDQWEMVAASLPARSMRQCRDRYVKYLAPDLVLAKWTEDEDRLLDEKIARYGPHWKYLATFFPNRTDVSIKNRWKAHHRKNQKRLFSVFSQQARRCSLNKCVARPLRLASLPIVQIHPKPETPPVATGEEDDWDLFELEGNWPEYDQLFPALDADL
jgi:hypothetical protein